MKKFFLVLAVASSMLAVDAVAQVKSPAAAKSAVSKAEAAVNNPKQNTKSTTWIKYGDALLSAYDAPVGNVWLGMSYQEYALLGGGEKPSSESQAVVGGRPMLKLEFEGKNLYFNENSQLEIVEVTEPVVEDVLDKAFEAYRQAAALDPAGKKTKNISQGLQSVSTKFIDDAYTAYSFGRYAEASVLFEKAAAASAEAPLSQLDTNSVYNAGYTAWMAGDYERAKPFFEKCLANGYTGVEGGEVYSRLADIAEREGDKVASKNYLEEGFSKYPQSQGILVGLINYYVTSGEDTDRLFVLLEEARKNEPNNPSLYYVEGNIHKQLGNGEAAVAAYRECANIDPNYAFGYIGEGVYYYDLAVDLQNAASEELDDEKYVALLGEFETALKSCIAPFETAFELTDDVEIKVSVAEYLKNACFRFRTESDYQAKYEKYSNYNGQ